MGYPNSVIFSVFASVVVFCFVFRRIGLEMLFPPPKRFLFQILLGSLIGIVAPVICVYASYLSGEVRIVDDRLVASILYYPTIRADGVFNLLLLFVKAAFVEETLFRGVLLIIPYLFIMWLIEAVIMKIRANASKAAVQRKLSDGIYDEAQSERIDIHFDSPHINRVIAITVALILIIGQAFLFSMVHGSNPYFNGGLAMLNIFLAGLLFGILTLKPGSFWMAILVHFLWNTTSAAAGSPVSGYIFDFGNSYTNIYFEDTGLWSGGAFGIEGGLACSFVLSLTIISYSIWAARTKSSFFCINK
jgi:membrane protease YdiL (CAAX protease family)